MAAGTQLRWFWISAAAVFLDRLSKLVLERSTPEGFRRALIPGWLDLVHTHNPGVAFGIFSEAPSPAVRAGLIAFSVGVIALVGTMLARGVAGPARQNAGLALILGGALGNLVDRLQGRGVLDFVDCYAGTHHWPAFNVADSCIVIGAGLVMLEMLLGKK